MLTLGLAGAIAGLVIVLVFGWADPRIQAYRAKVLREAVQEVLSGPARYETLYVTADGLSPTPPAGVDTVMAEKVFLGYDASDEPIGYAITGSEPGFQDFIFLIFGYDAGRERVLGMKVLESKETPGLGDKIFKDLEFVDGFREAAPPLVGVKPGAGTGDEHEVDMITGATISSRTVIEIINHRIEDLGPLLESGAAAEAAGAAGADDAARTVSVGRESGAGTEES
jgi:electron transport complex protein RnfG